LGVARLVADLNFLYRNCPALHELDHSAEGFDWVDADNHAHSIFVYRRKSRVSSEQLLVVLNMTPVLYHDFRAGVPRAGYYEEKLNTDAVHYGGMGHGNLGGVHAEALPAHGCHWSLALTLPPLSALVFAMQTD
jgi:1,4-alpha-glucan branching enzyme